MARSDYVGRNSPPSAYAIASLLEGEKGSVGRVVEATLLRTAFLVPGLYLATPYRGVQLLNVALAGSASITVCLIVHYALKKDQAESG